MGCRARSVASLFLAGLILIILLVSICMFLLCVKGIGKLKWMILKLMGVCWVCVMVMTVVKLSSIRGRFCSSVRRRS